MSQNDNVLFHLAALLYSYKSDSFKTENVLKKIIESMLVINGNQFHTFMGLSIHIKEKMSMVVSVDEIEAIICNEKNSGFAVDYSSGEIKFCLNPARYAYIMNMNTRNMDSYIQEFVQLNGYTEDEKNILERYLYFFYRKNFNDIQNVLGNSADFLPEDSTQFSDAEYAVIRKFVEWDDQGKSEQMLALASYALEYTLVAGETNLKNNKHIENAFGRKNIYIDTNILFYCLGINGKVHEESNKLFLKKCKQCNENIVISYYTDAELRSTFAHFREEINRLNNPLVHNVNMRGYFSNNDVYHYYVDWSREKKHLNDGSFFIRFLLDKYNELINEFNIKVEKAVPFSEEELVGNEMFCRYEKEIIRTSTINYDARNVFFVEHKRQRGEKNIQNVKDIFISADKQLQNWDMKRKKMAPVVISPNTWLLLLARFWGRNDDDFKCFISYINQVNHEQVINNKEFFEVLKTVYEIVEEVKQQESVVAVMVEEEFAFLNNNGEKRSVEFINEKTREKTYDILENKIIDLSDQVDKLQKQIECNRYENEKGNSKDSLIQQLREEENEKRNLEHELELLKQESSEKDKTIRFLQNKNKQQVVFKIVLWTLSCTFITIPILIELYNVFVTKNQNPISYRIFQYFVRNSIFDNGTNIELYGKGLDIIVALIFTGVDFKIIKHVIALIKKYQNADVDLARSGS